MTNTIVAIVTFKKELEGKDIDNFLKEYNKSVQNKFNVMGYKPSGKIEVSKSGIIGTFEVEHSIIKELDASFDTPFADELKSIAEDILNRLKLSSKNGIKEVREDTLD